MASEINKPPPGISTALPAALPNSAVKTLADWSRLKRTRLDTLQKDRLNHQLPSRADHRSAPENRREARVRDADTTVARRQDDFTTDEEVSGGDEPGGTLRDTRPSIRQDASGFDAQTPAAQQPAARASLLNPSAPARAQAALNRPGVAGKGTAATYTAVVSEFDAAPRFQGPSISAAPMARLPGQQATQARNGTLTKANELRAAANDAAHSEHVSEHHADQQVQTVVSAAVRAAQGFTLVTSVRAPLVALTVKAHARNHLSNSVSGSTEVFGEQGARNEDGTLNDGQVHARIDYNTATVQTVASKVSAETQAQVASVGY